MLPSANMRPLPYICVHVCGVCMCAPLSICALCVMDEALSSILIILAVGKPVMGYNIVCVLCFLSSMAAGVLD